MNTSDHDQNELDDRPVQVVRTMNLKQKNDQKEEEKEDDEPIEMQSDNLTLLGNGTKLNLLTSAKTKQFLEIIYRINVVAWIINCTSCMCITILITLDYLNVVIPVNFPSYNPPESFIDQINRDGIIRARIKWQSIEKKGSFGLQYLLLYTLGVDAIASFLNLGLLKKMYDLNLQARRNPSRWIRFGLTMTGMLLIQNSVIGQTEPRDFMVTSFLVFIIVILAYRSETPSAWLNRNTKLSLGLLLEVDVIIAIFATLNLIIINLISLFMNMSNITPFWFSWQEIMILLMILVYCAIMFHQHYHNQVELYLQDEMVYLVCCLAFDSIIIWSYVYDIFKAE